MSFDFDPGPGNGRNSEAAFATRADGAVLLAYTKYVGAGNRDNDPSVIATRLSTDEGRTWSDRDEVLVSPGEALNVMAPSFTRLADGVIAVEYLRKSANADGSVACVPQLRFSHDELKTLSDPFSLTAKTGYHVVNNDRVVQLSTGRLIVPVAAHRQAIQTAGVAGVQHRFPDPGLVYYLLSDDRGQTWRESTGSYYRSFPDGHGLQEPGVIELMDGRLWSWTRTGWTDGQRSGRQWESFSDDAGDTWSEPAPSAFISPRSPLSMKRIPHTGHLLAVWNDHSGRFPLPNGDLQRDWGRCRNPLVAAISEDDGRHWQHTQRLEDAPGHGFCYTAIHFVDDAVLLAYSAGGPGTRSVLDRLRIRRLELGQLYTA